MRVSPLFLLLLWCGVVGSAQSTSGDNGDRPASKEFHIDGWHEAVVSVRRLEDYKAFFIDVAQWQALESGAISRAQLQAWGISTSASARYQVYGNPGTSRGFVRLVEFSGVEQGYNRLDAQAWDTGGIYNINMRVADLQEAAKQMRELGWQAKAPITQFSFGPFDVKEWIVRSPDGLQIALIERIKPKLTGWPYMRAMSRSFNSTQMVKDIQRSLRFYEEVLGFQRYLQHRGASEKSGPHVLGMPQNYAPKIEREVVIVHPDRTNEGSVELLQFHGFEGADYSKNAHFPNLGIGLLRFPVSNIAALQRRLIEHDTKLIHTTQLIRGAKRLVVSSPEGAWLEFYQTE